MTTAPTTGATQAIELDNYRILAVSGDDRIDFLQGQLTQDVRRTDSEHSVLAGWASAKGRLLAVGQLIATPEALLWPLPADIIASVARRLGMFLLRARTRVDVTEHIAIGLIGLNPDEPVTIGGIELGMHAGAAMVSGDVVTARLVGDPTRAWLAGPSDTVGKWCSDAGIGFIGANEWRLLDIRAGLGTVVAATSETFIPQMLNLDLVDGISFTKGCYVGQEIVARTQNLGRIKRRMYRFRAEVSDDLEPAATIYGPDGATGKVVLTAPSGDATELTAVISIELSGKDWYRDEAKTQQLESLPLPYLVAGNDT